MPNNQQNQNIGFKPNPKPKGFSLFGAKPKSNQYQQQPNYLQMQMMCQNCGHPLIDKGRGLDHATSYPDLRTNTVYCSVVSPNGRVCGCESPSLPMPANCPNCKHPLSPNNTGHYEEFTDLRSNVPYCKVRLPNGQICGCDNIYSQQGNMGQQSQTRAGQPQQDKPKVQNQELIDRLTQDLIGEKERSKEQKDSEDEMAEGKDDETTAMQPPKPLAKKAVKPKPNAVPEPKRKRGRPKGSVKQKAKVVEPQHTVKAKSESNVIGV